jgi:hypothetical protein
VSLDPWVVQGGEMLGKRAGAAWLHEKVGSRGGTQLPYPPSPPRPIRCVCPVVSSILLDGPALPVLTRGRAQKV